MMNTSLLTKLKLILQPSFNLRIKSVNYKKYNIYYVDMNRLALYPFGIVLALSIQGLSTEVMAMDQQCISTKAIESDELSCLLYDRIINDTQITSMRELGPLKDNIATASSINLPTNKSNSEPVRMNTLSMPVMPLALGVNIFPSSGNVGIGTDVPQKIIHLVNTNTPTIRFEQVAGGSYAPYTWDVGANEANFFIRDQSGSEQLPFRIAPGNATNTLTLKNSSVGIGTWSPESALHVIGSIQASTLSGCNYGLISDANGVIGCNNSQTIPEVGALNDRISTNEADIVNLQQGQDTLNQLAVQYDSATQDTISLKGVNGTTLTNLKAGDISTANSRDAVTGGQLFTTNQSVRMLSIQATAGAQQIASILGGGAGYSNSVFTLPTFTIQGENYSNIGDTFGAVNTEISSLKTSVTNLKTYVDQQSSGSENNLKSYIDQQDSKNLLDAKNYTDQKASNTLNSANTYTDQQTATILNSANQYAEQQAATALKDANAYTESKVLGVNTGTGNTSGTGANSTAIGPNTVVSGNNSTAVGVGNTVSGNNSGAFGDPNIVTANGSYIVGNDNTVSGDNTFVLGNNVNTSAKNSVVLGHDSTSARDNTVSVGSSGNERQITNVADATEATDAVNLHQMQAANTETLKSSKEYTDTRVSTLESSFSDFSYQTDLRFKEVDKRFDRQGAMSAAMMNMATSTAGLKGLNRVGVAAGFQGNEKAVAIGYQRIISANTSLSLGGAFTDKDSSGGAGIGFSW